MATNPDASVTAVIAGSGTEFDGVCKDVASFFAEVWKVDNEALSYINAEMIRPILARILPKESIVLVSVGRGIEDEDNLEIIFDLAKAMGADVSCSRPIVDAKWLEKSRQVGTSGLTVKPKVYMALGISGAFQHLGGIKGAPFIVAVNKNVKAPIFQAADVGIVVDILDFVPELTEKINDMN
jgi:hypothetical protein